jgi:hypothetical protein
MTTRWSSPWSPVPMTTRWSSPWSPVAMTTRTTPPAAAAGMRQPGRARKIVVARSARGVRSRVMPPVATRTKYDQRRPTRTARRTRRLSSWHGHLGAGAGARPGVGADADVDVDVLLPPPPPRWPSPTAPGCRPPQATVAPRRERADVDVDADVDAPAQAETRSFAGSRFPPLTCRRGARQPYARGFRSQPR